MAADAEDGWRAPLARRFGVDARALAAFRVAVAGLLLADLALRARYLRAFYTDAGVLPRAALRARHPLLASLSLHAISGAAWVQAALFLAAAVAALALLVGYRTRLAAVLSWLLLASLHARNPIVLSAGDSILRRVLLWGLFLPLGARWSVDARRRDGRTDRVVNAASAALLLQVVLVYSVNAAFKLRGDEWLSGVAARYVFALDDFTVLLGDALASRPDLLAAVSHAWLAMLVASPLLVLLTGRRRAGLVAAFLLAHLGMLATMRLGLFPLVSIAALLPFLPPRVWDRVTTGAVPVDGVPTGRLPGSPTAALDRALPAVPSVPVPGVGARLLRRATTVVVVCLLGAALAWNAAALGVVDAPDAVTATVSPAEHRWDMFAPDPRHASVEYVATGELSNGRRVTVLRPGRFGRALSPLFGAVRWRTYLLDLQRPEYVGLRDDFADYLCSRWNHTSPAALQSIRVTVVVHTVRLHAPDRVRRRLLVARDCGR